MLGIPLSGIESGGACQLPQQSVSCGILRSRVTVGVLVKVDKKTKPLGSSPVVAGQTLFADVPHRGFADLDPVVLCIAALGCNILLVQRAALGRVGVDLDGHLGLAGLRAGPFDDLARAGSRLVLVGDILADLDGGRTDRRASGNIVGAVHGDEGGARAMTETALDGPEETADLHVGRRHLDLDQLAVFLDGAVCLAVGVLVEERGDLLGKAVADVAELFVVAVDVVGVVAVGAVVGVGLEVVGGPGLFGIHGTRDGRDGVAHEADIALLPRAGRGLGGDDGRHLGVVVLDTGGHLVCLEVGVGSTTLAGCSKLGCMVDMGEGDIYLVPVVAGQG